jgi:hypothetical protein
MITSFLRYIKIVHSIKCINYQKTWFPLSICATHSLFTFYMFSSSRVKYLLMYFYLKTDTVSLLFHTHLHHTRTIFNVQNFYFYIIIDKKKEKREFY